MGVFGRAKRSPGLPKAKTPTGATRWPKCSYPKASASRPHTHTREDESYYVLEGEFVFRIGGQSVEVGPGDYVWLPRGVEHGFELKTEQAKALIAITPAELEGFFKQLSEPAPRATLPPPPDEPPDFAGVAALMEEYGVKLSPPPAPL